MTDVYGGQSPDDSRKFAHDFNEDGSVTFQQVPFNALDFGAVFGGKTTSTTQNTASVGLKTFTLNVDDGKIAVSYFVQITCTDDPDVFMYGIVTRKDTTSEPAEIDVAVQVVSPRVNTSANWEIQVIGGPIPASDVDLVGISASSVTIGTGSKSFTIQSGKFFPAGSSVIITCLTDRTQKMSGIVSSYSGTSLVVTTTAKTGSGTYTAWLVYNVGTDLSASPLITTSATSLNLATVNTNHACTLTIDTADFFTGVGSLTGSATPDYSHVLITSVTDRTKWIYGFINSVAGSDLNFIVQKQSATTGTFVGWVLRVVAGPQWLGTQTGTIDGIGAVFAVGQITLQDPNYDGLGVFVNTIGGSGTLFLDMSGGDHSATFKLDDDLTVTGATSISGTHTGTSSGTNTGDQTPPAAATQAEEEAFTSITAFTSPGRQHFHPAMPKAMYQATITPTAVAGAATSWDTTAETCLWNTTHGLTTGEFVVLVTNAPGGTTVLTGYFVNVVSTTVFSLHLTKAAADAGTSKVNITSSTLTTIRKWVYSNVSPNFGMSTVCPIGAVAATTSIQPIAHFSVTLSSAFGIAELAATIVDNAAVQQLWFNANPSTLTTTTATFAPLKSGASTPGSHSNQATTAFTVTLKLWGDL